MTWLFPETKKGKEKASLRHQEGPTEVAEQITASPGAHTLPLQDPPRTGWAEITPLFRWGGGDTKKSDSPKVTQRGRGRPGYNP